MDTETKVNLVSAGGDGIGIGAMVALILWRPNCRRQVLRLFNRPEQQKLLSSFVLLEYPCLSPLRTLLEKGFDSTVVVWVGLFRYFIRRKKS